MSSEGTTRRGLIGATALAGVALGAGRGPSSADAAGRGRTSRKVDVVVVGAGLAGLSAARQLVRAGKSVVVLEARDRVGGRTLNHQLGGRDRVTELGGQFVGPTQERIIAMADALGVRRFAAYRPGDSIYLSDAGVQRFVGGIPPDRALGDVAKVVSELDALAARVPIDKPWTAPNAADLDSQTLRTWIYAQGLQDPARATQLVEIFLNSAFGSLAGDVSLLYMLAQVAGFGDRRTSATLLRAISSKGGAQDSRFVGGSQLVSQRAAERLGSRVVLRAPVRGIEQRGGRVAVSSDRGTWHASHVILAVPPALAVEIAWNPMLPPEHDALRRRMPGGTLMKCEAVYERPFWRDRGLAGAALHLGGVTPEMFDNTPPGGKPGVLMGFLGGESWRTWRPRSVAERRRAVLAGFAQAFGREALRPIDYVEKDWTSEAWSRGGPVSVLSTGTLTALGAYLTRPFGRVHWAGTETATYWNGYMDGAVSSGERAAREVLRG